MFVHGNILQKITTTTSLIKCRFMQDIIMDQADPELFLSWTRPQ